MRVLIVSGGLEPSLSLLKEEIEISDKIICADSGANCFYKYKLMPDYLLGDFDSIDKRVLDYFSGEECNTVKFPPEKDYTDTELAMNLAMDLGAEEIVFLGCTGSRYDHFFGNLALLYKCLVNSIDAKIKDGNNVIFLTRNDITLVGEENMTFSVMPYSECVKNLSIIGAKYDLKNYDLKIGNALTISNEFKNTEVDISFDEGVLIIFYSED